MTQTATSYTELLDAAVRALTAAGRLKQVRGTGTDQESAEPIDFAEFLTLATAAAAANIGGIETILAGRPGSWEADYVRQMLISTVGEETHTLLAHRTEPLHVDVHVDEILNDLGYWQLYDEAEDELQRHDDAIGGPAAVPLEPATAEQVAARRRIDALRERVDELMQLDKRTYGEAFKANVTAAAAALYPSLRVPVEITVHLEWSNATEPDNDATWPLLAQARSNTPLPSSGIPLKDYPLTAAVADIERVAGRTPLARIAAARNPGETTS